MRKMLLAYVLAILGASGFAFLIARLLPIHGVLLGAVLVILIFILFRFLLMFTVVALSSGKPQPIFWEITDELLILHGYAESEEPHYIPLENIKKVIIYDNMGLFYRTYPGKTVHFETSEKKYLIRSLKIGEPEELRESWDSMELFLRVLIENTRLTESTE